MNRETWLNELAALMAPRFEELGFPIPAFRVSVGFTSRGKSNKVGAECWHSKASTDGRFEVFIGPQTACSMEAAAYLAHELSHAAAGFKHKHRGDFAKLMRALGMLAPMTGSNPGPDFKAWAQPFLDKLGDIPHAALRWNNGATQGDAPEGEGGEQDDDGDGGSSNDKPKQKTRMLKACCTHEVDGKPCGYTVRLTKKWAESMGAMCPAHGPMEVEGLEVEPDDEGEED